MYRFVMAFVIGLMVLAAGCGDSGGSTLAETVDNVVDSGTESTAADTTASEDDGAGNDDGATDLLGNPAGTAVVELDDGRRLEFELSGACQKLFGAVQGAGPLVGGDGNFDSVIPPEDWDTEAQADFEWDPPQVAFEIDDRDWDAEAGLEYWNGSEFVVATPDQSAVTSFTNDGANVSGEANFFAVNSDGTDPETISGRFAFGCP